MDHAMLPAIIAAITGLITTLPICSPNSGAGGGRLDQGEDLKPSDACV
jgi:hypothetical protein